MHSLTRSLVHAGASMEGDMLVDFRRRKIVTCLPRTSNVTLLMYQLVWPVLMRPHPCQSRDVVRSKEGEISLKEGRKDGGGIAHADMGRIECTHEENSM